MSVTKNFKEKCVMARVMRQTKKHQKNFTLKEYGIWEKAEKAAIRWEQGMKKTLPPKSTTKDIITHRNSSGVVGVRLDRNETRKRCGVYEYWRWVAFWPGCPHKGGLGWSINKFGDENAFVLAVLSRRHESIDREFIHKELQRIQSTEEYLQIISVKEQSPPK